MVHTYLQSLNAILFIFVDIINPFNHFKLMSSQKKPQLEESKTTEYFINLLQHQKIIN